MNNGPSTQKLLRDSIEKARRSCKATRQSFVIDCPVCAKEDKCYIRKETGQSICFVCGTKWGLRGILIAILGVNYSEVDKLLFGFHGEGEKLYSFDPQSLLNLEQLSLPELSDRDFIEDLEEPYKVFYMDPSFVDLWESDRAIFYNVEKRQVSDPAIWVRHEMKYHAGMDAVVVPVRIHGTLIGYQARFIEPKSPMFRMRTSDGLPRERALMGYDQASEMESVIVVEGIYDMLKTDLFKHGIGSVATMGKVVNEGQIELIKKLPAKKIYLGLDRDAEEKVHELCASLAGFKEVHRILPPDHRKDFGECNETEVIQALGSARPSTPGMYTGMEVYLTY